MKKLVIIVAILVAGVLLLWKYGILSKQPELNTNLNNATTTPNEVPFDELSQEELFKESPLYKIVNSPLSKKYTNTEIGFSLMLPEKVTVKKESTYFGINYAYKVFIDESGYENSLTDLWTFFPDKQNPARNRNAKSLEDYLKDYSVPDMKNHIVVIHNNEITRHNVVKQEYSYGSWQTYGDVTQFVQGTAGCDACYYANYYIRYVYFNPKNSKFFIIERASLAGEFYENSIAYKEKEALVERISKTLVFE